MRKGAWANSKSTQRTEEPGRDEEAERRRIEEEEQKAGKKG